MAPFDQKAAQVYIEAPANGAPWTGDIEVRGATLPGWTAKIDVNELPVDSKNRFHATVQPPSEAKALAIRLSHGKLGFDDPRVLGWLHDADLTTVTGMDALNVFKEIRMVKSEAEIELLRVAGRMSETALNAVIDAIEPGLPLDEITRIHAVEMARQGGQSEF